MEKQKIKTTETYREKATLDLSRLIFGWAHEPRGFMWITFVTWYINTRKYECSNMLTKLIPYSGPDKHRMSNN